MIELRHITKHYKMGTHRVVAVSDVTLSLHVGDFIGLVGPSGCGKSTIMAILGLLDQPTQGHYDLMGQDTAQLTRKALARLRNEMFGFVFQSFCLLPRLSALENVSLPLVYRGVASSEIQRSAMAALDQFDIAHLAKHKPNEMSGGQQQRVAMARALIGEPRVLLADEPTGALDSKTGQHLMEYLLMLNKEKQMTVLLVTHDPCLAKQCKTQISMKDGHLVDAENTH